MGYFFLVCDYPAQCRAFNIPGHPLLLLNFSNFQSLGIFKPLVGMTLSPPFENHWGIPQKK